MSIRDKIEQSPIAFAFGLIITSFIMGFSTYRFLAESGFIDTTGTPAYETLEKALENAEDELNATRGRIELLESIEVKQNAWHIASDSKLEDTLENQIPKLLAGDDNAKKTAIVILHILHPSQVEKVLERFSSISPNEGKKAKEINESIPVTTGEWLIVFGKFKNQERARKWADKAEKNADFDAAIYHRKGVFRTALGPYVSKEDAEYASVAAKVLLSNQAYVVRDTWCRGKSETNKGYFECGKR